ncbi:psbP domain-containing protein 2, chloroplastic [Iris pallida]|uniref:PsbP domain-containing protein 2, chloroplastic n=1 Tax=Iris pallida TaxID=29817 RepID=A0AAX6FV09_IRIPA|nr:psbP domain-containing protein 2, chloroplastic [Iris pallida]
MEEVLAGFACSSTMSWSVAATTMPPATASAHHPILPLPHPHQTSAAAAAINSTQSSSSTRRRRNLLLSFIPFLLHPLSPLPSLSEASETLSATLQPFIDPAEGFTLLVPSSWAKVDKAGATALFEEQGKKGSSNNIGVVVNPVRLDSLRDFGTPQFVADKLIQAERRKESTKQAEVVAAAERLGHGGVPVYEIEYTVDSTRGGMKRIFSAAFVASKKLHLLNISYSDRPDNPLDDQTRLVLEKILHSFDTAL